MTPPSDRARATQPAEPVVDAGQAPGAERPAAPESAPAASCGAARAPSGTLAGLRVLVLRPRSRSADLFAALADAGAVPVEAPAIATETVADRAAIAAVDGLADGAFDWVAFTSAAAVDALAELRAATRAAGGHGGPLVGAHTRVAAVGYATAAALFRVHVAVDLIPPTEHSAAGLIAAWPTEPAGLSVLLPHSDLARGELAAGLTRLGYRVVAVTVYRTERLRLPADVALDLGSGEVDAVLVTSPSAARALSGLPVPGTAAIVAIGETTRRAVMDLGLPVAAVAAQPSVAGLVAAVTAALRDSPAIDRTRTRK